MAFAFSKTSSAVLQTLTPPLISALERAFAAAAGMDLRFDDDHFAPSAKTEAINRMRLPASIVGTPHTGPSGTGRFHSEM